MKIELNNVQGTYDVTLINSNFDKVEQELNDKVLYRDNPTGEPNQMKVDLDMNSKRVFNLPAPMSDNEPARKIDLGTAQQASIDASASATQAATSASEAAISATQASASATQASNTVNSLSGPTGATLIGHGSTTVADSLDGKANLTGAAFSGPVSAPSFNATSSKRYKDEIHPLEISTLEALNTLSLFSYRLISENKLQYGVIAEELADGPLDFVVNRNEAGEPESVNYQSLFILSLKASQVLLKRVESLEQRMGV